MARRISIKQMRKDAPVWIFAWRPLKLSPFPKWFATLLVAAVFTFFLTSVNIRVKPPTAWASERASVIQAIDDAEGRAMARRAQEGGPFPARFELSEWPGTAALEQAASEAAHQTGATYVPVLRDLTDEPLGLRTKLAAPGERVLPKLPSLAETTPDAANRKLAPTLYPLSGILAKSMPGTVPPFNDVIDAKMSAEPWRFLVCLDSAGNVTECFSLAGGSDAGPPPLVAWLRRVTFPADSTKPSRWITVGVEFTNQAADGPDAR